MMLITIRMLRLYVGATHGAQPGLAIEREGLFVLAYIRRFYWLTLVLHWLTLFTLGLT